MRDIHEGLISISTFTRSLNRRRRAANTSTLLSLPMRTNESVSRRRTQPSQPSFPSGSSTMVHFTSPLIIPAMSCESWPCKKSSASTPATTTMGISLTGANQVFTATWTLATERLLPRRLLPSSDTLRLHFVDRCPPRCQLLPAHWPDHLGPPRACESQSQYQRSH